MKFGEKLFQTKLLSRLSHKVCRLLPSPVLLRKFTNVRMGALINKTHLKGVLMERRALNRILVLEAVLTGKQPRENIQC